MRAELGEKRLGLCGQLCQGHTALCRLGDIRALERRQSGVEVVGGVERGVQERLQGRVCNVCRFGLDGDGGDGLGRLRGSGRGVACLSPSRHNHCSGWMGIVGTAVMYRYSRV